GGPGHLPVDVSDGPVAGGEITVPGDASSQFLSGLLLAGIEVTVEGPLVSEPYVALTRTAIDAFAGGPRDYHVEPDASAASYFFALAAASPGRSIRVEGVRGLQGDWAFVDVLASMGASVARDDDAITVTGAGELRGVEVDMTDISDTAQTLAAIAPLASSPTRITGIGFIRRKETDRVGNTVRELRRLGIDAVEEDDGFVVHPGAPQPATIETYDDHRMAMSFGVLAEVVPGITIADPDCVGKTYPGFWDELERLR
ncbi:MAG TPA: 3-phosphoshikimate 1-carboxyvinyltransferase, partial [Acidimicrobiales bacterium]|nr:3-phosphoshikimate 1-carboxyvinyltransferase [Acidimicrobiales bacterium]